MSEGIKFFESMIEERVAQIHTAIPCKVESFDEVNGTADVVPLFMRKFKGQPPKLMPKLVNVRVNKRKYKRSDGVIEVEKTFYEKGDIVLVVFAERALDIVLSTGQPADPKYNRKHALEDGIIVGLL